MGYGQQPSNPNEYSIRHQIRRPININVEIEGAPRHVGQVFYAGTDWIPQNWGSSSLEHITTQAHQLYDSGATACGKEPKDPLYEDWHVIEKNDGGVVTRTFIPPDWDKFEARLTPFRLASEPNNKNLAFLFLAYEVLRVAAVERSVRTGEDREVAIRNLGEPPWVTFNRFCKEADLKFEVLAPEIERRSILGRPVPPYSLMLRDIERGTVVSESEASAGERIMFSVVAWRFLAEAAGIHYKVMLLDEPDAHLHPSLVKQFLRVLETVMVDLHGTRVILTTHSPSTVALARDGQVFELKRHGKPRIHLVDDVSSVIAKLTSGLVAVDKATRFVVLEGVTDLPFYERLWQLLADSGMPSFPGVAFLTREGGCAVVRETVRFLREWDFSRFFGVLDRDAPPAQNEPDDGLFVLERNGVENYLFDPLNVWLCLWMHKSALHARHLYEIPGLRQGNGHLVKSQSIGYLQKAVDSVIERVRPQLELPKANADERIDVSYAGGLKLSYPRWVIEHDDHALAAAVRHSFDGYPFPDRDLHASYMTLNLVPQDMWDIFAKITAK